MVYNVSYIIKSSFQFYFTHFVNYIETKNKFCLLEILFTCSI